MQNYWSGLLPKEETQAFRFIKENPAFDGRGVVVGILDTGVDPGAIGLQTTTTGLPKIIDIVDCSGSGDVIMGPLIKADGNELAGIGRKLIINESWTNPTGEFRVGIKQAFDLYPAGLKDRIFAERKKKWLLQHKSLETNLQRELARSDASPPSDDLKARIQLAKSYEKDFDDPGPIYDCVVFHDGVRWQAVVDTTETGDMSSLQPMTNFAVSQQYRRFSDLDALNFGVNIFDNGDILSIVGTRVVAPAVKNSPLVFSLTLSSTSTP